MVAIVLLTATVVTGFAESASADGYIPPRKKTTHRKTRRVSHNSRSSKTKTVYQTTPTIVYRDRIIYRDRIVTKPVIKIVEKEVIKEVPVEKIVEKEVIKEVPVEKIVEKQVIKEVPVTRTVTVEKPASRYAGIKHATRVQVGGLGDRKFKNFKFDGKNLYVGVSRDLLYLSGKPFVSVLNLNFDFFRGKEFGTNKGKNVYGVGLGPRFYFGKGQLIPYFGASLGVYRDEFLQGSQKIAFGGKGILGLQYKRFFAEAQLITLGRSGASQDFSNISLGLRF